MMGQSLNAVGYMNVNVYQSPEKSLKENKTAKLEKGS